LFKTSPEILFSCSAWLFCCAVGAVYEAQCIFKMVNTLNYSSDRSSKPLKIWNCSKPHRQPSQSFSHTTSALLFNQGVMNSCQGISGTCCFHTAEWGKVCRGYQWKKGCWCRNPEK